MENIWSIIALVGIPVTITAIIIAVIILLDFKRQKKQNYISREVCD
jgi:NhaP-type Na+/H+ or K+/H+ antiporter